MFLSHLLSLVLDLNGHVNIKKDHQLCNASQANTYGRSLVRSSPRAIMTKYINSNSFLESMPARTQQDASSNANLLENCVTKAIPRQVSEVSITDVLQINVVDGNSMAKAKKLKRVVVNQRGLKSYVRGERKNLKASHQGIGTLRQNGAQTRPLHLPRLPHAFKVTGSRAAAHDSDVARQVEQR